MDNATSQTSHRTRPANETEHVNTTHGFGARDGKGRELGAAVSLYELDMVPQAPEATWSQVRAPGHYYVVRVQATRNGHHYGASNPEQYFTTEAARTAYVGKYLKGAAKRAQVSAAKDRAKLEVRVARKRAADVAYRMGLPSYPMASVAERVAAAVAELHEEALAMDAELEAQRQAAGAPTVEDLLAHQATEPADELVDELVHQHVAQLDREEADVAERQDDDLGYGDKLEEEERGRAWQLKAERAYKYGGPEVRAMVEQVAYEEAERWEEEQRARETYWQHAPEAVKRVEGYVEPHRAGPWEERTPEQRKLAAELALAETMRLERISRPATAQQLEDMDVDAEEEAEGQERAGDGLERLADAMVDHRRQEEALAKGLPIFAPLTFEEESPVRDIVDRAVKMYASLQHEVTPLEVRMDLTAVHAHVPLDFAKLAGFSAADFGHDVLGIGRHLDRSTGRLTQCFLPRCARPRQRPREAGASAHGLQAE